MDPDVIFWFKILAGMMGAVVLLYFLTLRQTDRRLPEEAKLTPLYSTHVWLGSRHQWTRDSPKPNRFSIYPEFIVIHGHKRGHIHRREDLVFATEHVLLLGEWTRIKDQRTGYDSDMKGHTEAILAALRQAGYNVKITQSAVVA